MDQIRAVRKMILQAKRDGYIPLDVYSHLWHYFKLMYVAGWDGHTLNEANGCQKPVIQLDKDRKKIGDYPSAADAGRKLDIPKSTLLSAIKKGNKTRQGHYWKYKDEITEKNSHKTLTEKF
jgi:hypothetical protein